MTTGTMIAAGAGNVDHADTGDTVTYSAPAGCVLRRSTDLQAWEEVATPSPFVHSGPPAHYRIDCDAYAGIPIPVSLEVA